MGQEVVDACLQMFGGYGGALAASSVTFMSKAGVESGLKQTLGLGKTVQALGFLSVNPNPVNNQPSLPALIVWLYCRQSCDPTR